MIQAITGAITIYLLIYIFYYFLITPFVFISHFIFNFLISKKYSFSEFFSPKKFIKIFSKQIIASLLVTALFLLLTFKLDISRLPFISGRELFFEIFGIILHAIFIVYLIILIISVTKKSIKAILGLFK